MGSYGRLGRFSRGDFLALGGLGAAALVLGTGGGPARAQTGGLSNPKFVSYPFTLGVASGDPAADGAVLWTRLAPDPLHGGGLGDRRFPVRWEVANDENFKDVVRTGEETAGPDLGHSVHVELGGLEPAREYYYRFMSGSEVSPVGRTVTTPAAGAAMDRMRFAFASCSQYEHGYFTAYGRMAEEDLDLVVHLGDYIYEYGPGGYKLDGGNVREHTGAYNGEGEIFTLADYRNRHAQYKTDEDLQAAHAAHPWIFTWDDHELENNYADRINEDPYSPSGKKLSPDAFMQRRAAAYQAYYENLPLRRSSMPSGPDMPLYRRVTYGNLAQFSVLDTRQYRTDQPCDDEFSSNCAERTAESQSLTGPEQERWLLDGLGRSQARWNVLAQQVFMAQLDFEKGQKEGYNPDSWDGYVAARERLLNFVAEQNVANAVVLTGDVHNNWAADLKADFGDPDSDVLGSEFVATSISSGGDGADEAADENQIALDENPHVKYFNGRRGYVRCEITPDSYTTDYRVVPYVSRPGAPVSTDASFTVENGNPGIQNA